MKPLAILLIAALGLTACGRKGEPATPEPKKSFAEELAEDRSME